MTALIIFAAVALIALLGWSLYRVFADVRDIREDTGEYE